MQHPVDLHLHTNLSDGTLSPTQLINLVVSKNLNIIAITDHDTTNGLEEAQKAGSILKNITIIPGIELSTETDNVEIHLLGYGIDVHNLDFQQNLLNLRNEREIHAKKIVEKLQSMGLSITWEQVRSLASDVVARPHIARALMAEGYVKHNFEAFDKYIGNHAPAYISKKKLATIDAVKMLRKYNGVSSLAHPAGIPNLESLLETLIPSGLIGMDVYYGRYTNSQVQKLLTICKKFNIMALGGSDFHASGNPKEVHPGEVGPPLKNGIDLLSLLNKSVDLA
jgi:predicted metal-dependent phosphoesterase TrpH